MGVLTVRETVRLFRSYYPCPLPLVEVLALAGSRSQTAASCGSRVGSASGSTSRWRSVATPRCSFSTSPPWAWMSRRGVLSSPACAQPPALARRLCDHPLPEEADTLAERIVVIDRGVVIADTSPRELKARVASKRVSFSVAVTLGDDVLAGLPVMSVQRSGQHVRLLSNTPEIVLRTCSSVVWPSPTWRSSGLIWKTPSWR